MELEKLKKDIDDVDMKLDRMIEEVDTLQIKVSQLYLLKNSKCVISEKMLVHNGSCGQNK